MLSVIQSAVVKFWFDIMADRSMASAQTSLPNAEGSTAWKQKERNLAGPLPFQGAFSAAFGASPITYAVHHHELGGSQLQQKPSTSEETTAGHKRRTRNTSQAILPLNTHLLRTGIGTSVPGFSSGTISSNRIARRFGTLHGPEVSMAAHRWKVKQGSRIRASAKAARLEVGDKAEIL